MSPIARILIGGCVLTLLSNSVTLAEDGTLQALWERVFGDAVKLDPDTVAQVKQLPPGERLYIDNDGDGKLSEEERAAMRKAMAERGGKRGEGDGKAVRERILKQFDRDGDGKLNEQERAAARKAMAERRKERPGGDGAAE